MDNVPGRSWTRVGNYFLANGMGQIDIVGVIRLKYQSMNGFTKDFYRITCNNNYNNKD